MIRRVPHYYKEFHCIASECEDNCCVGGWEIDIDEDMARYYLNLEGSFGDRLRESITRTDEYCFHLRDGKCPFLDNKGLCEIYQVLGEDKMGIVCTQFPRYTEYYGSVKETGIGLACEEAARIIFSDRNAFSLESEPICEEETADSEFDAALAEKLFPIRDRLFALMEISSIGFNDKLVILLNICHEIQEAVNSNAYEKLNAFSEVSFALCKEQYLDRVYPGLELQSGVERVLYAYEELEVLSYDWEEQLSALFSDLHTDGITPAAYENLCREFAECIKNRQYEYENLIKYFLFRYFMKAAYDHDVFGKAQMIAANFLVLRDMDILRWQKNGGHFTFADRMDTIHIFSREVEYSEDNLAALSEEFLFDDIFELENLCGLLKS